MKDYKHAFTLAELMVVLTVIGVLAGVLIPVANNSRPDENVMKFKKASVTLGNVVRELVQNEQYSNGMLNKTGSGGAVTSNRFCLSMADVLSTKYVNCTTTPAKVMERQRHNSILSALQLKLNFLKLKLLLLMV